MVGGIPDLNARIVGMAAEGDKVYARLTVTGTNSGTNSGTTSGTTSGGFFGASPTDRSYEASMFDNARIEDGRTVERIQQSDTLSQLTQMYGAAAKKAAVGTGLLGAAALFVLGRRRRGRW